MLPIAPDEWLSSSEIIRALAEVDDADEPIVRLWRRSRYSPHGSEIIVYGREARAIIAWLRREPWGSEGGRESPPYRRGR